MVEKSDAEKLYQLEKEQLEMQYELIKANRGRKDEVLAKTKEGLISDERELKTIAKFDDMEAQIEAMMAAELDAQKNMKFVFEDDAIDPTKAAGIAAKNITNGYQEHTDKI